MLRIELERIWKRLQTRFKARRKTDTDQDDPEHPILLETIQPITNADALLMEPLAFSTNIDISGAGYVAAHTVPEGKRWKLKQVTRQACTAASNVMTTIGGVLVQLTPAATTIQIEPFDFYMDEGDDVGAVGTGNGADSARAVAIIVEEEDAY